MGLHLGLKPQKKRESPLKYPGMNAGAIDGKALITSPRLQPGVSISDNFLLIRASALLADVTIFSRVLFLVGLHLGLKPQKKERITFKILRHECRG